MGHKHCHGQLTKEVSGLQDECIRVQKVYDWVTDALTVEKHFHFSHEQLKMIENAMDDPSRRPLRIVCKTPRTGNLFGLNKHDKHSHLDVYCEQVGERQDVRVPVNGSFADAQLVDLLFTADIKVAVIDRHGKEVTNLWCNASVFEPFVLCAPEGTELFCKITKVICRIPSGTVLLNSPCPKSFTLQVTFCVDIQVEAEVKLEVLAKFCSPRENDIEVPEVGEQCPDITFPEQCPDIFPRQSTECSGKADASGFTKHEATEQGKVGIYADIAPNFNLANSEFAMDFHDKDTSDGLDHLTFKAVQFDRQSLTCEPCYKDGLMLKVSGVGRTKSGRLLDFNLALVDSSSGDQFQVQLFDQKGRKEFDTGIVDVKEGKVKIKK
ncbi:hypothetical protein [Pueribacillus sp. YX66]|uniref:hypothetical protein n=1 Tax=Pueribacillus sp. YX66 TaxID=3229242 RepID=UPI00358CE7B0